MSPRTFKESHKLRAWEVVIILSGLLAGLAYRFIDQFFIHPEHGGPGLIVYALLSAFLLIMLVLTLATRVSVKVSKKGLKLKSFPFHPHGIKIPWGRVEHLEVVRTPLLSQLSGGNISFDHARSFSACGRNGILLQTDDGEKYLVGSRQPDRLCKAMTRAIQ